MPKARPNPATRTCAIVLVAAYVITTVSIAVAIEPVDGPWLAVVALLPGLVTLLFGIPKVVRSKPRGILAVFHLLAYPLFAIIVLGFPGAYVTYKLAAVFTR